MESTFKLTVFGIQPARGTSTIRSRLLAFFEGNSSEIDEIIQQILTNQPVVLAENLLEDQAQNFLQTLTNIGLNCRIEPMQLSLAPVGQEDPVYQCPACGQKQPPALNGQDICQRC